MHLCNLFEADPIDFDAYRRKKAAPKVPDNLKYAAAKVQQQPSKSDKVDLGDMAREIVLRNIDKVFAGEPLPDEDRETLNTIVKASNAITRMKRGELVREILNLYGKVHGMQAYKSHPDPKEAYLRDDPSLAKWRLRLGKAVTEFESEDAVDRHVLTVVLKDGVDWPEDRQEELRHQIEYIEKGGLEPEETKPFDPMKRQTKFMSDEPDDAEMLPFIRKILNQYEDTDKGYWIYVAGWNHDTGRQDRFILDFHNKHAAPRQIEFPSMHDLEKWVLLHRNGLAQWAKRQEADVTHDDPVRIRMAERRIVGMIRTVLTGNADPEKIKAEAWKLLDYVIAKIKQPDVKNVLESMCYQLANEKMWKFLEEYHLTWLPERISELMSKTS